MSTRPQWVMPRNKGFSHMVNESDLVWTVCRDCDRRGEINSAFSSQQWSFNATAAANWLGRTRTTCFAP
jgi:hypothetical protein